MKSIVSSELSAKITKRGQRVYVSNANISSRSKLKVGDLLQITYAAGRRMIKAKKTDVKGKDTISVTPSGKGVAVDLHNQSVKKALGSAVKKVTVMFMLGALIIKPSMALERAYKRILRAKCNLEQEKALTIGEVCHGVGGLGLALHSGFNKQGVGLRMAFANDIDEDALAASIANNPVWEDETIALNCSIEEIPLDILTQVDVLAAGLSCKGASLQARTGANKKLTAPEFHSEAGWLVAPFYHLIASEQIDPLVVLVENVCPYLDSASAEILRNSLDRLGYDYHELIIKAYEDFGCLENRNRAVMVFVTKGLDVDLSSIVDFHSTSSRLQVGDVIDTSNLFVNEDKKGWYSKDRLIEREEKARQEGRGHRAVISNPSDSKVSTLTASYGRGVRLDESCVESNCGMWLRLFNKYEHNQIKEFPVNLVNGVAESVAHRLLGNSIQFKPFEALGQILAKQLKSALSTFGGVINEITLNPIVPCKNPSLSRESQLSLI